MALPFLVTGWAYCRGIRSETEVGRLELWGYMGFVPLTEGSSINLDDGALDKSIRSDQFVVGSVVNLRKSGQERQVVD